MSPAVDAYYPIGAAACCTPALLLDTGDAWCAASACLRGLARCACHVPLTTSLAVSSSIGQLRGQALEWALCGAQAACNLHRQLRAGRASCSMSLTQVWPVAQGAGAMRVRRRAGHQLRRHHHAPAALWLQQLQVHAIRDAGAQQDNSFQAPVKAVCGHSVAATPPAFSSSLVG